MSELGVHLQQTPQLIQGILELLSLRPAPLSVQIFEDSRQRVPHAVLPLFSAGG